MSQKVANDIHAWHQLPRDRITVVHNGVDLVRFHLQLRRAMYLESRQRFGIGTDERVVLAVAHNHRLKGVSRLLELLRLRETKGRSLHLLVVGDIDSGRIASMPAVTGLHIWDRLITWRTVTPHPIFLRWRPITTPAVLPYWKRLSADFR